MDIDWKSVKHASIWLSKNKDFISTWPLNVSKTKLLLFHLFFTSDWTECITNSPSLFILCCSLTQACQFVFSTFACSITTENTQMLRNVLTFFSFKQYFWNVWIFLSKTLQQIIIVQPKKFKRNLRPATSVDNIQPLPFAVSFQDWVNFCQYIVKSLESIALFCTIPTVHDGQIKPYRIMRCHVLNRGSTVIENMVFSLLKPRFLQPDGLWRAAPLLH